MNWPEAMVAIAAMICGLNLLKAILRFVGGVKRF